MKFRPVLMAVALSATMFINQAKAQTAISIESVTNLTDDTTLAGGVTHLISFRYDARAATVGRTYLPANGWEIYSPDGADWEFVQAQLLSPFSGLGFEFMYANHFHKTGGTGSFGLPLGSAGANLGGHDTVGVVIAGVNSQVGSGLPRGFNDIAVTIEFATLRSDAGLHICIKKSTQLPGGSWVWANADGLILPDWSDDQCWVIGCCFGQVGDVDGQGGDEPTISDIAALVDHLFITQRPIECLEEADVNLSGTELNPPLDPSDISIGDVAGLVDHLFVEKPPMAPCP